MKTLKLPFTDRYWGHLPGTVARNQVISGAALASHPWNKPSQSWAGLKRLPDLARFLRDPATSWRGQRSVLRIFRGSFFQKPYHTEEIDESYFFWLQKSFYKILWIVTDLRGFPYFWMSTCKRQHNASKPLSYRHLWHLYHVYGRSILRGH